MSKKQISVAIQACLAALLLAGTGCATRSGLHELAEVERYQIRKEIIRLEVELEEAGKAYRPAHPRMKELEEKREHLNRELLIIDQALQTGL